MTAFSELTVAAFLDAVAAPEPAPGGGAAAAATTALAAGLVAMSARFSHAHVRDADQMAVRAEALREGALPLADQDAAAYAGVLAAYRLPKDAAGRGEQIRDALERACEVPLRIAEGAAEVAMLAADIAARGNPNLKGDAATAVHLAVAAVRSATGLVLINAELGDLGPKPVERADDLMAIAEVAAEQLAGGR